MGKPGQPSDRRAWDEKRRLATQLLEKGYAPGLVARHVGTSRAWVQRIDQERRELKAKVIHVESMG